MRYLAALVVLCWSGYAIGQTCPAGIPDPVPRDQARLDWTRPATYSDSSALPASVALIYTVYRRVGTVDTVVCTTTTLSAGQTNLATGTHTWVVTARIGTGTEGPKSNAASKTVAEQVPGAPVLTVSSTLVGDAAWQCRESDGDVLSRHTRQDKAQEACTNQALANVGTPFEVHPSGFFRVVAR